MNQRSRRSSTVINLLVSHTTTGFLIVSGIVLVPLYLQHIPSDLYGAWIASGNIIFWLAAVDPGITNVLIQRISKSYGSGNKKELISYFLSGSLFAALIAILMSFGGWLVAPHIPRLLNIESLTGSSVLVGAFHIAVLGNALLYVSFVFNGTSRAMLGSIGPGVVVVVSNFVSIAVIVVLILSSYSLYAIAFGMLVRGAIQFSGNLGYILYRFRFERIPIRKDFTKLKELLGLFSYTSIGKLSNVLSKNTDSFLIGRFLGPETVTVFSLTRKAVDILVALLSKVGGAIAPSISHLVGQGDFQKINAISTKLIIVHVWIVGLAFGGVLAFNKPFVEVWVGLNFYAGYSFTAVFSIFLVTTIFIKIAQSLVVSLGDLKLSACAQFVEAILTFTCLFFGIRHFGLIAAAIAPLVGQLAFSAWYYAYSLFAFGGVSRDGFLLIAREMILSFALSGMLAFLILNLNVRGWIDFLVFSAVYVIVYITLLAIVSAAFRQGLVDLGALIRRRRFAP